MILVEKNTISISSELFNLISQRIKNPQVGFDTVEDYVDYVLRELLLEDSDTQEKNSNEEEISQEEAKKIREELKKLGYV